MSGLRAYYRVNIFCFYYIFTNPPVDKNNNKNNNKKISRCRTDWLFKLQNRLVNRCCSNFSSHLIRRTHTCMRPHECAKMRSKPVSVQKYRYYCPTGQERGRRRREGKAWTSESGHGRSIMELSALKTPSMQSRLKLEPKTSAELETVFRGFLSHANPAYYYHTYLLARLDFVSACVILTYIALVATLAQAAVATGAWAR